MAYVAPISRALEDGRHEKFLKHKVATKPEREKVWKIQEELMRRKPQIVKMLEKYCNDNDLKFYIPINQVYDYEVLELEFSYWQWGVGENTIPSFNASDEEWASFLINFVDPDYFSYSDTEILPFYYQTIKEFGYYGYYTKHLGKNASIKNTKDYIKNVMATPEMRNVSFDKTAYKTTCNYLKHNDPTHIFIYGEYDPWTASGVAPWLNCNKKTNMKIYVKPKGNHSARIENMPLKMRKEITEKILGWMK